MYGGWYRTSTPFNSHQLPFHPYKHGIYAMIFTHLLCSHCGTTTTFFLQIIEQLLQNRHIKKYTRIQMHIVLPRV